MMGPCMLPGRPFHFLLRLFALVTVTLSIECGFSASSPSAPTPSSNNATVSSVAITGGENFLPGQTTQLTSTATLSNGKTADVTTAATWTSSNPDAVTVSRSGLVMAVAVGAAKITATYQGVSGSTDVSVSANAQISACGTYSGAGPFVVGADLSSVSAGCLRFSNTIAGQLDCRGHDVSSVVIANAQGFTVVNCLMHFGAAQPLLVLNSSGVIVRASNVLGQVGVQGCQNCTFEANVFRYPLLPTSSGPIVACELCLSSDVNVLVSQNTIDGGWDGNLATYEQQGCDDGIVPNDETNLVIKNNTIRNVFDAGIEPTSGPAPATMTITGNTMSNLGFTGIGGYYIPGWQNSTFSGNTVTNAPSLIYFDGSGAQSKHVAMLTLVNNRFADNVLLNPTILPQIYRGGQAPAVFIDYTKWGVPFTVSGNVFEHNDFGHASPGPMLVPPEGFIDGGGNICLSASPLACLGFAASWSRSLRPHEGGARSAR